MKPAVIAINSGSSSVKFALFELAGRDAPRLVHAGQVEAAGAHGMQGQAHEHALRRIWDSLGRRRRLRVVAAGHRVVHGGERFRGPVLVQPAVLAELERLAPLAPLHQDNNLAAIRAVALLDPGLAQVACFDTSFHLAQPAVARAFALPRELSEAGVKRFGFHGLSYEHIAGVLPRHLGALAGGKVVVAHLGSGASMCAMWAGRSVATTTGFSALDGLPMGTRCGSIDPGALLYLLQERKMDAEALSELLWRRSGLLGMSGVSQDMRVLLASAAPAAAAAVDVFVYRAARELGSLAAALGGLDALVFTGGIGEHSPEIRSRICAQAAWLGVALDEAANAAGLESIGAAASRVPVLVIAAGEEAVIAAHTARLLAGRLSAYAA